MIIEPEVITSEYEPDEHGHFGPYGGTYVPETLIHAHEELKEAYYRWRTDDEFMARLDDDYDGMEEDESEEV